MTLREIILLGCMLVLFAIAMSRVLAPPPSSSTLAPSMPSQRLMEVDARGNLALGPTQIAMPTKVARLGTPTGFLGFGVTPPECPVTIHAEDGREACLDWRSGTVTYSGELSVDAAARLFVEALNTIAPWPPVCAQEAGR